MKLSRIILLIWILCNLTFAQYMGFEKDSLAFETIDTLKIKFHQGVSYYNQERYWDALNIFEQFNSIPEAENHLLSASGLMLIKTYLRLGDLDRAIQLGREFVLIHTTSRYLDDVEYALGEAYLIKGKYHESIFHYLNVMQITDEVKLRYISKQTLETIIDLFISTEQLVEIIANTHDDYAKIFLTLKLAEKLHIDGDTRAAEKTLASIKGIIKGAYFDNEFKRTSERIMDQSKEKIYIGVILPLSGQMAPVGQSLLNGVRYAVHQFRATTDKDLTVIAMNNLGDVVESIKKVEFLCNNPKVKAIFGPVTSENTIAVAAMANQRKVPQISPTATSSEISSLGPYVFQANVDFVNLGRFLGNYSSSISKVKTVASISPADEFGKEMTDSFCGMVDELGGRVVAQQWYQEDPEELKHQFTAIRQAGLDIIHQELEKKIAAATERLNSYMVSDSLWLADSIYVEEYGDNYRIFKPDSIYVEKLQKALIITGIMDSIEFAVPQKDSLEYRISSIDGLLVPAYASDLEMLMPQLEYYNLDTKIFGSGNWNDPELLKKHPKIVRRLTFISDYYIDTESRYYKNFERNYIRLIGSAPGRFDLYGFDTMQALLSAFEQDDCTRESVRKNLAQMPTYHGVCKNISFRGNRPRANSCAFILKIENDKARPVAAIENGDLTSYSPRY